MSTLTSEQQSILSHIKEDSGIGLTLIDSVAGSGKTTLLVATAKAIPHDNGLYIAYSKAIATEASRKFPKTTACMTTHSMAYQAVFNQYSLKLGDFTYRSIIEKIPYERKLQVVDSIREYCLSKFTSYSLFCASKELPPFIAKLGQQYLDDMLSAKIECTHEFYLKLFHVLLDSGHVTYDPFDFIMLDEAGDLNEVTLEIFRLLPSPKKIAVGDPFQNIFTFNHTINCFEVLKDEGTLFRMSQSFRVSDLIAPRIERFCQTYMDPDMSFVGVPISDTTIHSTGYITRTNSALIGRMIELNLQKKPYGLVRKASEIFKFPLMLCSLKHKGFITDMGYKHLQADIDDWYEESSLRTKFASPLSYLASVHPDDFQLQQGIRLILRHGKSSIMDAYTEARKHEKARQFYTLCTAHSSKGLEFDEVHIASDLNDSISDIIAQLNAGRKYDTLLPPEVEALNLYYVSCSRAKVSLVNATHL